MKRIAALAILAIFALFNPCFAGETTKSDVQKPADETTALFNSASAKFYKQDIQGAIDDFSQAIKLNPNNIMLYLNRGYVKQFVCDYGGAMADYNKALEINPNFAFAYNNRGVLKVSMNDTNGALEDYAKAISINPKYSDVYYNRGNLKYMLDDNQGALEDYDMAINLNPKDSEAYNNRGVVKKRMNCNVAALSDYSQAIALNPNDSIAYANRGRLKKLYFDNEGAAIDIDKAVALAENQIFIKNVKPLLSNEHYIAAVPNVKSIGRAPEEVKSAVENLISYSPAPSANSIKVDMKEVENEKQQAEKFAAKQIEPQVNQTKLALRPAEPTVKQKSSKTTMTGASATVLSAGVGTVKFATPPDIRTEAVTKPATTNVKLAESYYIRGLQKCILRDMQGAIADLDKAISNNDKYADAYYYRAAIKKQLGDVEGFKSDYKVAIQINPALQSDYNENDVLSMIK